MKYHCIKTESCSVCKNKGTIQVFLNSANLVKYARTRHYSKGIFSYCRLENLREVEELLKSQANHDQKQAGQAKLRSNNLNASSFNLEVEPRAGFGPATITLPR